ncbi:FAD-dependent monooxygenase [Streptomyces cavernicola]|uniref:FAD-dependent monooxygenase n=1 Tax=Streptomyces cavernicola TaxID=3043613 RepID=A0ABT6S368_9ACTN|nr:FAD-dependent monooxygenase [Streptomyces sp. B-S-A6]MDI3402544.1 FAD-dependent monooxygenase [Streptomyces sp. B-S-A6]
MDPVIVVGAGPVGLTLSLALAHAGVPSVVLDEGPGKEEQRPARTAVLREDTADLVARLTGRDFSEARWAGWRSYRRKQEMRRHAFTVDEVSPAPVHLVQHTLTSALREAVADEPLVKLAPDSRVDAVEQDAHGVSAHTRSPKSAWWRGSYLVGCDGPRSTVRKLLDIRFPGRTAVERHAVAALRAELPWPGEAVLHRLPPWPGAAAEITARPLPEGAWRLDWLLPARSELITPDVLLSKIRDTLAGWCGGSTPPYDLLDTGVHTVHHRLARSWRSRRCFLAGDAAHLLGALATQGVDEGLRDADNLSWKLAQCWHQGESDALLDSYQAERRSSVAARLRAADQALPILRGGGGLRAYVPGTARGHDALLTDGHVGRGPLGSGPSYANSLLSPDTSTPSAVTTVTPQGSPVADVPVTVPDGTTSRLRDRLGRGRFLVLLIAPGTGVWERRHWMTAGVMPRLAAAVTALPVPGELLVAERYPGAGAHTVLLIRPDGHLVTALNGVRPAELYAAADTARGGPPAEPSSPEPSSSEGAPSERVSAERVSAEVLVDEGTDLAAGPQQPASDAAPPTDAEPATDADPSTASDAAASTSTSDASSDSDSDSDSANL